MCVLGAPEELPVGTTKMTCTILLLRRAVATLVTC